MASAGTDLGFLRAFLHDLRSPLSSARRVLGQLQDGAITSERRAQLLEELVACLDAVEEVAEDGLAFERFEEEIAGGPSEPTDVGEIVAAVVSEMQHLEATVDIPQGPHVLVGHRSAIAEAVREMLDNAADHTPLGTTVRVRLRDGGRSVVVVVEDEGPGVPDHLQERIFAPFDRGEAPASRGGLGLGLVKVARVAELHGGRAWVDDAPTGGASFRLELSSSGRSEGDPGGTEVTSSRSSLSREVRRGNAP